MKMATWAGTELFDEMKPFMKTSKPLNIAILCLVGLALPVTGHCQTQTISFDTSTASDWTVTAGGVSGATPYIVNAGLSSPSGQVVYENQLSVTSTGDGTGSFLAGGNLANFDGFWLAFYTFSLPANATSISLNYGNFYADDRAVLTLNGNIFDATGIPYFGQLNSVGSMVFTDGGPLQSYSSFSSPDGFVSGTVTTGFNVGGVNTIEAIINNTHSGVYGPDINVSPGDAAFLGLSGTISYEVVPEPASALLVVLGSALFAFPRMRRCAHEFVETGAVK